MAPIVFLTGGAGFVGIQLLDALSRRGDQVVALDRSGSILRHPKRPATIRVVAGDLLDASTYQQALSTADVVVHLAASTGKASEQEHSRVIALGTEVLIDQCRRAGMRKLLYVSSIAAAFRDTRHYYYAQAKIRAEEAVRRSELQFAILRPTMILGRGSPILGALEKLSGLPVIPVFGHGRTRVQPVFVEDVVQCILTVLDEDLFVNQTFDIGGPEVLTMEELLQGIREARTGRPAPVVHVPLGLLLPPLHAAEALGLGGLLPISVGQLASFRHDGTVATNTLYERLRPTLRTVSEMLSLSADGSGADETVEDRECVVFTGHLLGVAPDAYVKRKYAEAHRVMGGLAPNDPFDVFVLRFAATHRFCTRVADAYARVFRPGSALRRKLIVLLAILETSPPSYRTIDAPVGGPKALLLLRLALRGSIALLSLLIGTLLLVPARLALAATGRRAAR